MNEGLAGLWVVTWVNNQGVRTVCAAGRYDGQDYDAQAEWLAGYRRQPGVVVGIQRSDGQWRIWAVDPSGRLVRGPQDARRVEYPARAERNREVVVISELAALGDVVGV
jgi:hypothetical protein